MPTCRKRRFAHESEARAAMRAIASHTLDAGHLGTYRCGTCRYADGKRAWHWGHRRADRRRKQW